MKIDVLVVEIGSTTTVVNAFNEIHTTKPYFVGQGYANTSIKSGDVTLGINEAIEDLKRVLKTEHLEFRESFASSSAAGGLKMTVHGLVYDMTVKAAKEAVLGAGANILMLSSGKLSVENIKEIKSLKPNIILLAGGVDYGEKETVLYNAKLISSLTLNIPIIYAGNKAIVNDIKDIFQKNKQAPFLTVTNNVYPKIDILEVGPVRKVIQEIFEKHIIEAPGMHKLRDMINNHIIPTPGAVMKATELLYNDLGNVVCFDVGGATTDIHSVCEDSQEYFQFLVNPEPFAKRTVEGDLGIYINKDNIIDLYGKEKLIKKLQISEQDFQNLIKNYRPIPSKLQLPLSEELCLFALELALNRHAGKISEYFTYKGKTKMVEGKDLSASKYIIATGGALSRLEKGKEIIEAVINKYEPNLLKPSPDAKILIDSNYIMASIGVLSMKYPEAALILLKKSLNER